MYNNPIDVLVSRMSETEQTSSSIHWSILVVLLVVSIAVYGIGKYYKDQYKLPSWWKGFEKFLENVADKQAATESIIQILILQYSESIKLADMFTCFYRPLFINCYIDNGIIYYKFQFAGIKPEFRNRSNCILFIANTVRRYYQDVRGIDCGGVYVQTLTSTELCFGIAGNRYGTKRIALLLETQQRKVEKDMTKNTL